MLNSIVKSIVSAPCRKHVTNTAIRGFASNTEVPKYETLAVSVPSNHVYQVDLNRPDKLNTFNQTMVHDLLNCFTSLNENPDCRVVVLSASGRLFCAGIDLRSLVELSSQADEFDDVARKARVIYPFITKFQDSITSLEKCMKPVLSVVHNACVGAAVDLITAADIRYCTEDAWFQVKEADVGLAADIGVLQRLPKIIGSTSTARELCFTARRVDAAEALRIGLVTRTYPDKDTAVREVLALAADIAAKSPVAVQTAKQSLVYSQSRTNDDGLHHIALLNQMMLQSEDLSKAAIAQATKSETPEFENL